MSTGVGTAARQTSTIRRITEGRRRWRVLVETWPDRDSYHGRLVFRDEDMPLRMNGRESAALLHGVSAFDVLCLAHDLTEDRLRRVLNSLM